VPAAHSSAICYAAGRGYFFSGVFRPLKAEMKIDRATAFLGLFFFLFATRAITFAIGGFDEA
jgi:hypothetical protein